MKTTQQIVIIILLAGIHNVTRGWHSGREINTVTFDPAVITPEEMVAALKAAGTYAGTVE